MDAARADDSGGRGRGRCVTFPPLQSLGEGGGWEGGGARQKTNSFVFLPPRLFPYFRQRQKKNRVRSRKDDWLCGFYVLDFVVSHAAARSH